MKHRFHVPHVLVVALLCLLLVLPAVARAADPGRDFGKGALYGRVVDITTGQPIRAATVALQDKKGGVLTWTRTDRDGRYALAADTLEVLRLQSPGRRSLLSRIARGMGAVALAPVKLVGAVVKAADPLRTARSAAVAAVTGSPGPVVAQVAGQRAGQSVARTVLGERQAKPKEKRGDDLLPGEVRLVVSAPQYQEIRGAAGAYWMEPTSAAGDGAVPLVGARAWLETVELAHAGSGRKSGIANMAVLLDDGRLDGSLAPIGATLRVQVRMRAPQGLDPKVRVFAREDKKRTTIELLPQGGGLFAGVLTLDPRLGPGETVITVAALRAEPVEVRLPEDRADPLLEFARQVEDLQPNKPYGFDPRILASENRLDLSLLVLDPRKASPAGR